MMTSSALLFAGMGLGVKIAGQSLPNSMVVFFRSAMGLLVLLPWLVPLGWSGLKTERFLDHLPRTLFGLLSMYCYFYAIGQMRLSDAVLLYYSLPLFMPFIEGMWLGTPVPRAVWPPVGVGLVGVLLILKPGLGVFQPAALVVLFAALCAGAAQVGVRLLTRTEPVRRIVFYFALLSSLASAAPLPWTWQQPATGLWPVLVAIGVLATLGQLMMTKAYAHASAARVGPFMYTSVVFAALLDWLAWGLLPDRLSVAGAALVGAAGILALRIGSEPAPAVS